MTEETIDIGALELDCGETLPAVRQRVTIDGADPASDGSNVVFAAHALTGSSRVAEWWPDIVGEGALFDRRHWCVIGINVLGGCYGSTRPSQRITVRDIVRAQRKVFDRLEIPRLAVVVGGSLGGMQALQWALDAPERVAHAIVIGASDHHTAMGIALNAVQREAIALDPVRGVALARKIAMLTYKSDDLLAARHDRNADRKGRAQFDVEGYLDHQGAQFIERMDGQTYTLLTHAMDSFDVRGREAPPGVDLTFVGISSDWLFRPQEIRAAAKRLHARYLELESNHGHDAFLAEPTHLRNLLSPLLSASEAARL
ncbi:MAG TPA: alpha/beta fold hydrolase [Alphaproteobacteria bacterium]|nr:alpha/beta fold hydrolase [Alphaproteobacteria bacterium]